MSCSPNWDGLPCDNNLIYKYFQHLSTACAFSKHFFFKDWPKYKFACFFAVHLRSAATFLEQERNKHEAPSVSGEESGDHTLEDGDQSGVQVDCAHVCTVGKVVLKVSQAITEHLAPEFIRIPHGDELCDVVRLFDMKWGFPRCFGAIYGSHIPIVAPDESPKDYFNRKGWFSLNIQVLVDSRYRFIDLCIGWPGSVHDARVLSRGVIPLWRRPVSILGFENCQSFFSATAHVRCTAPAGRHRAADAVRHIAYFIGKTTLRSSYQPTTCEQLHKKHNIVTCLYKTSRLLQ